MLIPNNFEGNLRVVYEENGGDKYEKTNDVKTLIFPENGILILNEQFDRHINYKYYFVDDLGRRTEIQQSLDFNRKNQKRPYVFVSGSGVIGQTIEANSTNKQEKGITYSDFYVYNKESVGRNDYKTQEEFDSLTTAIVKQCRQENNGSH